MAKGSKQEQPVVEASPAAEGEEDYAAYLGKAATGLQTRFSAWIKDKTGIAFTTRKEEAAFDEGVRIGVALRMKFQASPENQAVLQAAKAERASAAEAAPAPTEAKPAKAKKEKAPAAAPVVAPVAAEPAKPKPAKKVAGKKAPF